MPNTTRPTKTAIKNAARRTDVLRNELCEVLGSNISAWTKLAQSRSIEATLKRATAELERLQAAR